MLEDRYDGYDLVDVSEIDVPESPKKTSIDVENVSIALRGIVAYAALMYFYSKISGLSMVEMLISPFHHINTHIERLW